MVRQIPYMHIPTSTLLYPFLETGVDPGLRSRIRSARRQGKNSPVSVYQSIGMQPRNPAPRFSMPRVAVSGVKRRVFAFAVIVGLVGDSVSGPGATRGIRGCGVCEGTWECPKWPDARLGGGRSRLFWDASLGSSLLGDSLQSSFPEELRNALSRRQLD